MDKLHERWKYDMADSTELPKHLILDLIAADMSLHKKPDLMFESFMVTGIISNMNGANDHMIWSETDIKTVLDDEHEYKIFTVSQNKISLRPYKWITNRVISQ